MITSTNNSGVKHIEALQKKHSLRQSEGVFVVEGLRIFREIPADRVVQAYVTEEASAMPDVKKKLEGVHYELVSEAVIKAMSGTVTSQGMIAVVRQSNLQIKPEKGKTYMLLDRLQDPGNLGTIIRMSEAAGISGVVMSADTVDIYNPKVVRSTMGTIFRVPFMYADSLTSYIEEMKKAGVPVYGASLTDRSVDYASLDYRGGCGFVIGNEAGGISDEVAEACSSCVHIPMAGNVESLNAAVAASVLGFEAFRQSRIEK